VAASRTGSKPNVRRSSLSRAEAPKVFMRRLGRADAALPAEGGGPLNGDARGHLGRQHALDRCRAEAGSPPGPSGDGTSEASNVCRGSIEVSCAGLSILAPRFTSLTADMASASTAGAASLDVSPPLARARACRVARRRRSRRCRQLRRSLAARAGASDALRPCRVSS
jgi:hypothetical protein